MKRGLCVFFVGVILFACIGLSSCKKQTEIGSRYEITAEYRENARTLTGTVKLEYQNVTGEELSELKFNLYPNAYRKNALFKPLDESRSANAYYAGESYGNITITSVGGVKNWSIDGEDENILTVVLVRALSPSDKITLDISFVTTLAKVEHFTGVTAHTVNLAHAFPTLCAYTGGGFAENNRSTFGNSMQSDYADYKVTITVPSEYAVVASTDGKEEKSLESKTKHLFEGENLRDFALVLSKHFEIAETKIGETTVRYYYYDDNSAQEVLSLAKSAVETYSETFGSYLYPTYAIAQTPLCVDGCAYSGLLMLSDSLGEEEKTRAIVKQTAKQWWYSGLRTERVNESWLEEGLSAYSESLFFEQNLDHGVDGKELAKQALQEYRSYFSVYGSVFGGVDTSMRRSLYDFSGEYEYRCLTEYKSLVMWDTLEKSIGKKKLLQGLKAFYKTHRLQKAGEEELVKSFAKLGVSVDGFFHSFLAGKAVI
jgi:hypothetical protein